MGPWIHSLITPRSIHWTCGPQKYMHYWLIEVCILCCVWWCVSKKVREKDSKNPSIPYCFDFVLQQGIEIWWHPLKFLHHWVVIFLISCLLHASNTMEVIVLLMTLNVFYWYWLMLLMIHLIHIYCHWNLTNTTRKRHDINKFGWHV